MSNLFAGGHLLEKLCLLAGLVVSVAVLAVMIWRSRRTKRSPAWYQAIIVLFMMGALVCAGWLYVSNTVGVYRDKIVCGSQLREIGHVHWLTPTATLGSNFRLICRR